MSDPARDPRADVNKDGTVNAGDILEVRRGSNWQQDPPENPDADVNLDGLVNSGDVLIIRDPANWMKQVGDPDALYVPAGDPIPTTWTSSIYLERGGTWNLPEPLVMHDRAILGAYGSGPEPKLRISGNRPALILEGNNLQVTHLDLHGDRDRGTSHFGLDLKGGSRHLFIAHCAFYNFNQQISFAENVNNAVIEDCFFLEPTKRAIWLQGENHVITDCGILRSPESAIRSPWFRNLEIKSCNISGGGTGLKLHATPGKPSDGCIIDGVQIGPQFVPWACGIGPQNATSEEIVRNVLITQSTFLPSGDTQVHLYLAGPKMTVDHCTFQNREGSQWGCVGVVVTKHGLGPAPTGCVIGPGNWTDNGQLYGNLWSDTQVLQ